MNIETLAVGEFEANCHIVWTEAGKALVIDPGADADLIIRFLQAHKLTVAAYLLTHGHVDHISGLAEMCRAMPAPVAIHEKDFAWAFSENNQMPPFYGVPERPTCPLLELQDGETRADGGFDYQVIATPGHTPGCVCFLFRPDGVLFTGDTLFAGSVGRTDLPGGDSRQLQQSIARLAALDGKILVYAGHGPASSLAHEKKTNFFMRGMR